MDINDLERKGEKYLDGYVFEFNFTWLWDKFSKWVQKYIK